MDALLTFSADLFTVPLDIIKAEAIFTTKSGFYFKFKEQPPGITVVASSLTFMLPKFIGEKIIFKKIREYLERVINLQYAGVGYDFERRLEKSKLSFRWDMLQRIDATVAGIENAVQQGISRRERGLRTWTNERRHSL
ncbi:MAG: hypothetical protein MZW92_25650 [Comamonadaceae bacterium]|nr:hypothetical protein [Comamonadaceae bacterium]